MMLWKLGSLDRRELIRLVNYLASFSVTKFPPVRCVGGTCVIFCDGGLCERGIYRRVHLPFTYISALCNCEYLENTYVCIRRLDL
jgi:hypothetical protein